jgi:hypothetical protein
MAFSEHTPFDFVPWTNSAKFSDYNLKCGFDPHIDIIVRACSFGLAQFGLLPFLRSVFVFSASLWVTKNTL